MSDRLIQQGAYLYGVRFGKETDYLMLDIDFGSLYHPSHDSFAISRILAALEPLGLVEMILVSSSYRNGIHLYLPFPTPQESWAIAQATSILLKNAGFKLKPGQLELFPNPRPYSESTSLYAAHRLPLQAGSYLLNADFQPIFGNQTTFVQRWTFAQQRNEIDRSTLKRLLKQAKRKRYKLSNKAEKFLNDLNTEVETGWTGKGQTNYLLGRIAMREYIFGHVQRGSEPLAGENLVDAICQVARSLPGFETYCNHQADLEQRAVSYAGSIQASHYYPFGYKHQRQASPPEAIKLDQPSWNQQQSQSARDRIRQAVADLLEKNALPAQITARKNAIKAYGIGSKTLDKYKVLWHPDHLKPNQAEEDHPISLERVAPERLESSQGGESHPLDTNKLVHLSAAPQGQAEGFLGFRGAGGISTASSTKDAPQSVGAKKHLAKMQVWLESGDSILEAEAQRFFAAAPEKEQDNSAQTDAVEWIEPKSCLIEDSCMPGGFGVSRPKQQKGKARLKEIQQLSAVPKPPSQELQRELAIQAEVEAFFAQYQQEHPEELADAWSAGVYNPLAKVDLLAVGARFLEPAEEDWLGLASTIGWLLVEDELDAIYFTAPPPNFALEQADWYVRPDLTTFLEEPVLLREVIHLYPIPLPEIQGVVAQLFLQLGWTLKQQEQLIQELFEKPETELTRSDWELLLLELQSRVQDEG